MPFKGKTRICEFCTSEYCVTGYRQRYCKSCAPDFRYYTFIRLYGLNKKKYDELMSKFNGKCYLCENRATCVDHDHSTGKVRGALCNTCNVSIGFLEKKDWLTRALEYKNETVLR